MRFLVVGCGSIGERHIRNLHDLAAGEILGFDTSKERLDSVASKYGVKPCASVDEALEQPVDAVLVCVPPSLHIPLAKKAIEHGAHLFIEKPLSHTMAGVDALLEQAAARRLVVYVGYNLRWHPGLKLVKQMIGEGRIGRVISASAEVGQYLPDWHPWEDYRRGYTARNELGGGIILDASHELDYIRWLLGEVAEVSCLAGKLSSLEVNVEDTAEILLKFTGGAIARVHLDFVQRAYSRSCKLIGEEGTILWDYGGEVKVYTARDACWEETRVKVDGNGTYVEEIRHFIECIRGKAEPLVSGAEGRRVLEIAIAAKESSRRRRAVSLEGATPKK